MLSRKHFNEIARILKENQASKELINDFAQFCRLENPNFNSYRFKTACGLKESEI